MHDENVDVTALLIGLHEANDVGDTGAGKALLDRLWQIIYPEVHSKARRYLAARRPIAGLGATALVNEAYLKLARRPDLYPRNRKHLLALVTLAMYWAEKSIGESHDAAQNPFARQRAAGDPEAFPAPQDLPEQVVLVLQVLDSLETLEPVQLQVLRMKYLEGMTDLEIASQIGRSDRTVRNHAGNALTYIRAALGAVDDPGA